MGNFSAGDPVEIALGGRAAVRARPRRLRRRRAAADPQAEERSDRAGARLSPARLRRASRRSGGDVMSSIRLAQDRVAALAPCGRSRWPTRRAASKAMVAAATAGQRTRAIDGAGGADRLLRSFAQRAARGQRGRCGGREARPARARRDRSARARSRSGSISSRSALREVAAQADPVGEVTESRTRPNGLRIEKVRAPLGSILMIYEARPNVTADAAALCLRAGNAALLARRQGGGPQQLAAHRGRASRARIGRPPARRRSVCRAGSAAARCAASARGSDRSLHSPRRPIADQTDRGEEPDSGGEALPGGLPSLRRARRGSRGGGAARGQRQGAAALGVQRARGPAARSSSMQKQLPRLACALAAAGVELRCDERRCRSCAKRSRKKPASKKSAARTTAREKSARRTTAANMAGESFRGGRRGRRNGGCRRVARACSASPAAACSPRRSQRCPATTAANLAS